MGKGSDPVVRSDEVFEEFPEEEKPVTANPVETVQESVEKWR